MSMPKGKHQGGQTQGFSQRYPHTSFGSRSTTPQQRPDVSFHVAAPAFPPQQGGGAVPPGGPQLRGMHHSHHGAAPSIPPPHQQQPPPPAQSQHSGGPPGPAPTSTPPGPADMGKQGPPHLQGQPQMPQGGQMAMNFGVPNQGRSNQSQPYYPTNQRPATRMPNHRGTVVNIPNNVFTPPIPIQQMSMYTGVVPAPLNHNAVFVSAGQMPMFPGQSRHQGTGTSYFTSPTGQQQLMMQQQQHMYPGYQPTPQGAPFLFSGVRCPGITGASGVGGPGLAGGASQQVVVPGGPPQIAPTGQVSMMPISGSNVMGVPGLGGDSGTPSGPVSSTNSNSTGKQPRRKYALDIIDPRTMKNIELYETSSSSTPPHSGESSARETPQPNSGPGAMDVAAEFAARVAKAASEESSGPTTPAPYSEPSTIGASQVPVNGPDHIAMNSITPPSEGVPNQSDSSLSKPQIVVLEEPVSSTPWKQTQPKTTSIGNKTSSNSKCSKIEVKSDEHGLVKLEADNLVKQSERERPPLILGVPNVSVKDVNTAQGEISMTSQLGGQSAIPVTVSSVKDHSPIDTPIVSANTNSPDIELVHYRSGTREQYSCLKSSSPAAHSSPRRRLKGSDTVCGDKISVSQSMPVVSNLPVVTTPVSQAPSVSGLVLPMADLKISKEHASLTTMQSGPESKVTPMLPSSKKASSLAEPSIVVGAIEENVYVAPTPKERREEKTRARDRSSQNKEPDKIREKQVHDRDKSSQGRNRDAAPPPPLSTSLVEVLPPSKMASLSLLDESMPKSQTNGETTENMEGKANQRSKHSKRNQQKKELNRKGAEKEGTEMDAFAESPITAVADSTQSSVPSSQIPVSSSGTLPPNTTTSVLLTVSASTTAAAAAPTIATITSTLPSTAPVSAPISTSNAGASVPSHSPSTSVSSLTSVSTSAPTIPSTTTAVTAGPKSTSTVNSTTSIPSAIHTSGSLSGAPGTGLFSATNNKMNSSELKNDDLERTKEEEKLVAARNEENAKVSAVASMDDKTPVIEQPTPVKPALKSREGQVITPNPGEKIKYEREFLMGLKNDPHSKMKPSLPESVEVVLKDPRPTRPVEIRGPHDALTPKYLSSQGSGRGVPPKRSSQQGKAKVNKQGVIHVSLSLKEEVKLRETENAWKPGRLKQSEVSNDEEEAKTEELYKTVRGVLNKLTPQMFETLVTQVKELPIDNIKRLKGVIDLVFEKAVDEPSFSESYAQLCKTLSHMQVPGEVKDDGTQMAVNFRKLIVTRCQQEFEKNTEAELNKNARMKEIEGTKDPEKKKELQLQYDDESRKLRMKSVGNIRFIGELFKLGILTSNIMHRCIQHLLKEGDEESLECLCKLLTTVGRDLETKGSKTDLKEYFDQIKVISMKKGLISSRVRFMLQDVIELRDNKWIPRRDDPAPTTIDQIQKDANKEEAERSLNAISISGPRRNEDRGGDRRKNRTGDDGWSLAGGRSKNYPLDMARLRQKVVENDNLKFGCRSMFMWNSNSVMTDNSKKDSGPVCSNNSFAALQDMPSEEKKSSLSQIRSGRSKMTQSTAPEKKRTLPSYQSSAEDMQPQHGLTQQSRSSSRENAPGTKDGSTTSDLHTRSVSANPSTDDVHRSGSADTRRLDVPVMNDDQVRNHTMVLLDEYFNNANESETAQAVTETFGEANINAFVLECVNSVLEKSAQIRHNIGKLFCYFIKENVVLKASFLDGFSQVISNGDDLAIDIPKIWLYLAEFIVPLLLSETISFTEFREVAKNVSNLVAEVLKQIPSNQIPWVLEKWNAAGIKLTDFVEPGKLDEFVEHHKLGFMFGDVPSSQPPPCNVSMEEVQKKLVQFLKPEQGSDHSFDEICHWISTNVGDAVNEPQFIRALMTALCESAVSPSALSYKLKEQVFLEHSRFLHKYIDNKENLELQCLYAVQAFVNRLEHPQGLLCGIFQTLWDNNLISSDSFSTWETSVDAHEQVGKGVAMKSLKSFFTSLHEGEDESEES